jgi:nucleoside-diphosphate kinase
VAQGAHRLRAGDDAGRGALRAGQGAGPGGRVDPGGVEKSFQRRAPMLAAPRNLNPIRSSPMAIQRTFSIIKPDATKRNLTGKIIAKFEEAGLRIVASKRIQLTLAQAQAFYGVHKDRPFFDELCEFMISEPIVVQVLEGEDAIAKNREVMGATNPAEADEGTIRKEFALSIGENSVHGSDAPETAAEEIAFFFSGLELVG